MTDPFSEEEGNRDMAMPSSYKKAKDLADTAAQAKQADATEQLLRALKNKQQLSPSQGMAAALLATIPTIGGYLIGKSVGSPDIPEGTRFDNMSYKDFSSAYAGGGGIGGAMGAKLGGEISQGYENRIYEQQKADDDVLMELYKFKSKEADRLQQTAADLEKAGLAAQEKRDLIPLQEASKKRIIKAQEESGGEGKLVNEETRDYYSKLLKVDPKLITDDNSLQTLIRSSQIEDINERRQQQRADYEASLRIPGWKLQEGARPNPSTLKNAQELAGNYAELGQVLLPELRRVFTDPKASIDDQVTASADMVASIKSLLKMGANFTEMERALVDAGLPKIAELSGSSVWKYFKAEAQGQNPIAKIDRLETKLKQIAASRMKTLQYDFEESIPSESEDASDLKKLKDEAAAIRKQLGME